MNNHELMKKIADKHEPFMLAVEAIVNAVEEQLEYPCPTVRKL